MKTMTLTKEQEYRTRGEYGNDVTEVTRIGWNPEINDWEPDDNGSAWGAFDSDYGWMPNFYIPLGD